MNKKTENLLVFLIYTVKLRGIPRQFLSAFSVSDAFAEAAKDENLPEEMRRKSEELSAETRKRKTVLAIVKDKKNLKKKILEWIEGMTEVYDAEIAKKKRRKKK